MSMRWLFMLRLSLFFVLKVSTAQHHVLKKQTWHEAKVNANKNTISFVSLLHSALRLSASPLIVCGGDHPHLTFDLSQNVMHHHRALGSKAGLAVRVAVAAGRGRRVCQSGDGVGGVPVPPDAGRVGRHHQGGVLGRGRGVALEQGVELLLQPGGGALVLPVHVWVPAALVLSLVVQQSDQEVDVLDRQAQNFVLAELLVGRMCRDEFPQLGKSPVDVLLAPALTAVGEDATGYFLRRACREIQTHNDGSSAKEKKIILKAAVIRTRDIDTETEIEQK